MSNTMSNATPLGYIGLGHMGGPMARRLLAAGFPVAVWGRTPAKLASFEAAGARLCGSAAEVARASAVFFTCLTDTEAVRDVALGDDGVADGGGPDKILVDMSTIAPDATVAMAAALRRRCGMRWVDAPISGGTVGAEAGTLAVLAGGDEADVAAIRPVLAHLAANVTRMGPVGAGQTTKLANQTIVAGTMAIVSEAMALARGGGVDATALPRALSGGRGDSTILQQIGPGMAREDYTVTSSVRSMVKDMKLVQRLAERADTPMPVTGVVAELYRLLAYRGHAEEDVTTVHKLYADSGLD